MLLFHFMISFSSFSNSKHGEVGGTPHLNRAEYHENRTNRNKKC